MNEEQSKHRREIVAHTNVEQKQRYKKWKGVHMEEINCACSDNEGVN